MLSIAGESHGLTVIRIGDLGTGAHAGGVRGFVTYGLGSCIGVTVYDPEVRVGGMLHAQLPSSRQATANAASCPDRFVDLAVPRIFRACYSLGASKGRMVVKVAGAAQAMTLSEGGEDPFQIGRRNVTQLKKLLWMNGVLIAAQDTGGSTARSLALRLDDGAVFVGDGQETRRL